MKLIKTAALVGAAAMAIAVAVPAEATWNTSDQGYWDGRYTWRSSGWKSSGWGASDYGTSNNDISGSTSEYIFSSSSNGTGGVGNDNYPVGTPVPEPSNVLMLGLGVVGLVAGRLVARRRKSK